MKFETYPIHHTIKLNLDRQGLKRPTDIQFKAIPSILKGEDVLAIAQTGTGKTIAFAVPVVQRVIQLKSSQIGIGPFCIIMAPTRELAVQIESVIGALSRKTKVRTLALIGGVEQNGQIKRLAKGVDILIATPGRMFDLISQGAFKLHQVRILVLDEADQMLDRGFINDIKAIKAKLRQRHQTLFFSATINKNIKKLAFSQVKSNAIRIQISPDDPVSKNVSHYKVFVKLDDKRFFLRRFVRENPEAKILVFVRTMVRAERVAKALERGGIKSLTIHRNKDQEERMEIMSDFKSGQEKILIATDVTARGIDIPNVDYVINYDLPEQKEVYVHRVGRTGRGRKKGTAISFCSPEETPLLEEIEGFLNKKIAKIHLEKRNYSLTRDVLEGPESIKEMIRANEAWEKGRRKSKKKKN